LAARAPGDAQPTADTLVHGARTLVLFHKKRSPSAELHLFLHAFFLPRSFKTSWPGRRWLQLSAYLPEPWVDAQLATGILYVADYRLPLYSTGT